MRPPHRLERRVALYISMLLTACANTNAGDEDGTLDGGSGPTVECGDMELVGSLSVDEPDDIAMLNGVRSLTGELQIDKTSHPNLDFLACLEEIGGDLTIFGNTELVDVSGLDNITRIGGNIVITQNSALPDFNGLSSLKEAAASLNINNNGAMTALTGMSSLAVIQGSLTIRDNVALEHIDGLKQLKAVGSLCAVTHNDALCISSVNCVGAGLEFPAVIPDNWTTQANNDAC